MAAAAAQEVEQLVRAAVKLRHKGHHERGLNKWCAALSAAETHAADDCLVVAGLRVEIAATLIDVLAFSPSASVALRRAHYNEAFSHLEAALPTLRRRRDGGTLLPGHCRPAEEDWFAALMDADQRGRKVDPAKAAQFAQRIKQIAGYYIFMNLAGVWVIHTARWLVVSPFESEEEACPIFAQPVAAVEDAIALMVLPQPDLNPGGYSGVELILYEEAVKFEKLLANLTRSGIASLQPLAARTTAALLQLQRSGVLQRRNLTGMAPVVDAVLIDQIARVREAASAPERLRLCALAGCGAKEAHVSQFGKCGACKTVAYCCKEHQLADWPAHKKACKAARAAASEAA